jgi:hypothetical protein
MRHFILIATVCVSLWFTPTFAQANDAVQAGSWRALPLITNGQVDPHWVQIGYGSFIVDNGALRTECDEKGMGLLLYKAETLGNCQIRVVFKSQDAKSNAGVFVRIDPEILTKASQNAKPIKRDEKSKLSKEMLKHLEDASEQELGAWYPVHHGYEIQICDSADEYHRTGAIYSLAKAVAPAKKPTADWRTMIITLKGNRIQVEVDGQQLSSFDPSGKDVPARRHWTEPKRDPPRPEKGFIGLQNHDPGDVVYFKEVSVRPL